MALEVRNDQAARLGSAAGSTTARPRHLPIAEHGLSGDLHTVAFVGTDGTIDWYCCPRFDSPSVFGRSSTPTTGAGFASRQNVRGEQLGNFPQAFMHLALIRAAFDLDRRLG